VGETVRITRQLTPTSARRFSVAVHGVVPEIVRSTGYSRRDAARHLGAVWVSSSGVVDQRVCHLAGPPDSWCHLYLTEFRIIGDCHRPRPRWWIPGDLLWPCSSKSDRVAGALDDFRREEMPNSRSALRFAQASKSRRFFSTYSIRAGRTRSHQRKNRLTLKQRSLFIRPHVMAVNNSRTAFSINSIQTRQYPGYVTRSQNQATHFGQPVHLRIG